jgi:Protein of unknown function (DUF2591)
MKRKTSDLKDQALDWAVELAKGTHWSANGYFIFEGPRRIDRSPEWRYSTSWAQGGPIIERENIELSPPFTSTDGMEFPTWGASIRDKAYMTAYTALGAAMRCYVASKLGDEVDVPEELG